MSVGDGGDSAPDPAEAVLERVRVLYGIGRHRDAADAARRGLAMAPDRERLWTFLAGSLTQLGDRNGALDASERACALDPAAPFALRVRAGALSAVQRYQEALVVARQALALAPQDVHCLTEVARAARRAGEPAEARAAVARAAEHAPGDPEVCYAVGWQAWIDGRYQDAEAAYRRGLASDPGDPYLHDELGRVAAALGRCDEAVEHHRRALAISPRTARFHLRLSDALHAAGRVDDAIRALRTAVEAFPRDDLAHGSLCGRLLRAGRHDEALAAAEAAVAAIPDRAAPWSELAWIRRTLDDPAGAVAAARRAVEVEPVAYAHRVLSQTLWHLRRFDEALAAARAATDTGAWEVADWTARFWAARAVSDHADALASADRIVELAPGLPAGHVLRLLHVGAFGPAGAVAAIEAALIAAAPAHPETWTGIAVHAFLRGDAAAIAGARAAVDALLARGETQVMVRAGHAIDAHAHLLTGRWDDAERALVASSPDGAPADCHGLCMRYGARARRGEREAATRVWSGEPVGPARVRRCVDPHCQSVAWLAASIAAAPIR